MRVTVHGDPSYRVQLEGSAYESVAVPPNSTLLQRVYVVAPRGADPAEADTTPLRFWVEGLGGGDRAYHDTTFNGRGAQ